jgi:uncharacterized protein YbjT (DUF2867 family)
MFVVLGANGRAGGETAAALIAMGKPVRVVVRKQEHADRWRQSGAEIAIADIDNEARLTGALKDATGAFLLCPPPSSGDPYKRADEVGRALANAVHKAQVPKIAVLSSIGAQHETGTGVIATLNALEKHLRGSAPSTTFLRPGYFVETWSEMAETVTTEGVLPSFLELTQRVPMVSTQDVGRAAAQLLSDEFSGNRIVELRGAQDWSSNDVAAAFAQVLGCPVKPVSIPREDRLAILAQGGVPLIVAEALLGMYEGIANGRVEHDENAEQRRGDVALLDAIGRMMSGSRHAQLA